MRTRAWSAVIVAAAVMAVGGAARAETATCEVPIVHAQQGSGATQIDPKIDRMRPYLSRPPFTAWHDFKLIDRKELSLQENGSSQFMLPNGRSATLTFLGHTPGPGEHRIRLRLVIDHAEKHHRVIDTTYVVDEGGFVLHAGQKYEGGMLVLGFSCKTQN